MFSSPTSVALTTRPSLRVMSLKKRTALDACRFRAISEKQNMLKRILCIIVYCITIDKQILEMYVV